MEPFGIGMAGLGAASLATFGAFGLAFRQRRKRLAAASEASPAAVAAASRAPAKSTPRSTGERLEALVAQQAELGQRLEVLAAQASAPEERLQAMAGQLLALIRDKNATLETALAGLDQLRARLRALEQMGEPAEARALLDRLDGRLGAIETAQATAAAATEARLAALDGSGTTAADFARAVADLGERLARLQEGRDAGLETALARLAPLETRLGLLDGGRAEGREALKRLEARIETLSGEAAAVRTEVRSEVRAELAALKSEAQARTEAATAPLADQIARLQDRKDEGIEAVIARLGAIERELVARDPEALVQARLDGRLGGLDARLAAFGDRLARMEERSADQGPLAALAERLATLQADRDAATETMVARLGPVESRLAAFEAALAAADPQGALDRFAERLEAVSARMTGLEGAGKSATEISERLADLYRQKDAAIEALVGRLAPLEAKLAELDPQGALDRFAERLEAVQARVSLIEGAENPVAEITERLAELHAQKDGAVETLMQRLAPMEAKLAELDPQGALDRFAERLEAVQARVSLIEGAENPVAEITERLAELHAQKDGAVETLMQRLAPMEAKLAELDPQGALDRFAERLEAVQARVSLIEGAENPVAEITERLAELHAQKDGAVETLMQRLAPMEAKLAELDPQGALDRFAERLEAVQARVSLIEGAENPVAEITERLAELHAQKDGAVETLMQRLAPMEAKLAELDPQGALDRFAERLEAVQARVSLIEGAENPVAEITERLAELHAQKDGAVETLMQRLAPMEAKLAELDPQGALDRFAERLEAVQARVSLIEGAENPVAEITERLAELHAQKDGAVETLMQRLAPMEARLAEVEGGVARVLPLAEEDPRAALAALRERLESLDHAQEAVAVGLEALRAGLARAAEEEASAEGRAEGVAEGRAAGAAVALAEVVDGMTRLFAQKDAGLAALFARLGPLEERLAAVEVRPRDPALEEAVDEAAGAIAEAEAARAEARAVAEQLALVQAAAEASEERAALFADRISGLEASLPRLTVAEVRAMAEPAPGADLATAARGPDSAPATEAPLIEALRDLPRVVSLHQK